MSNVTEQWNRCLQILRDNLPLEQYKSWFEPIVAVDYEGNKLTLRVPSQYFCEQIEERYLYLLSVTLKRVFGDDVKLAYKCKVAKDAEVLMDGAGESPRLKAGPQLAMQAPSNPFATVQYDDIDPQLNPRYTFDNYCTSTSNRLAVSIAQAIASNPRCLTYNPMFIFGTTGVGKTHLMQAIGIKIKEDNPHARVVYLTARVFESQYTAAVRNNKVNDFIAFYQSLDVLLLDDIQEFAGKTATQNTFFHIFNHLHQNQRLLIMSSDCRPAEMDGMIPRLISRFKWGVTAELEKPDYDLRRKVLDMRAAQDGLNIAPDVMDYIAEHVTESVRELEGIVVSLMAHATMLNQDISLQLAQSVVANSVKITQRQINFEMIAETVAEHYDIDVDQLYGKSRKREISDARQLLRYFAKNETILSSTNIGTRLARTHATVLHACKQIEQRLSIDKAFQREVATLTQALHN